MALCGGAEEHKKLTSRINRIEGQIRGLKKMIAEERDCMAVLKQIAAASGALRSLGGILLEEHLKGCVATAIKGRSRQEQDNLVHQVVELFYKFSK